MAEIASVVDVVLQVKSSRFEPRFSYRYDGDAPEIGEVVQVALGPRVHFGYVVSAARDVAESSKLRSLVRLTPTTYAFDAQTLALATWMTEYYCCTLSEALTTVVYGQTLPRTAERIIPLDRPCTHEKSSLPERLITLLWDDFPDGIALEGLLRHPEARRAGDRATIKRALTQLTKMGAIRRERQVQAPLISALRTRRLLPCDTASARGKQVQALVTLVKKHGSLARHDAVQAGFSGSVIRRAVRSGALAEEEAETHSPPTSHAEGSPLLQQEQVARSVAALPTATTEQAEALQRLRELSARRTFSEILLFGITGSGKTQVYLEFIHTILAEGDTAIVLVPEISLTPQTAGRFEAVFGEQVVVLHSALSERRRFEAWKKIQRGEANIVVGARSAVFAPLKRLRAIIIDEAHETSYKQDHAPRYHAVTVARERMRRQQGVLLLGSATPPLEQFARAKLGQITLLTLRTRATQASLPHTEIIDLSAESRKGNFKIFSSRLVHALDERLRRGEKSILFVNRRGTARFVLCRSCGFVPSCRRCSLSFTYHRSDELLRCHLCDAQEAMHRHCPSCGATPLAPLGLGTERVASEILELFPHAQVIRMDSDTTTRLGDHARLLDRFEREGDILVGTQMVAKGLDFPTVTLAGVVAADVGLHIADYRASERSFSLLTQVAGRSGRTRPGEAIIQTYLPEHPAVALAAQHDYESFARSELAERRLLHYPPFTRLAYLGLIGREREFVRSIAEELAARLREGTPDWESFGPSFYSVPRVNNEWRIRVTVKARSLESLRSKLRGTLIPWIAEKRGVRLVFDLEA